METCFNFSKCKGKNREFKVYVYPEDAFGGQPSPSENYAKVKKFDYPLLLIIKDVM